jgi:two-component system, OmpR family, copper resistance phosphate regulon response regulator CusR
MNRILLVEDDLRLSQSVESGLKTQGYQVETVFDGEMALRCFNSANYDLVLLDLNLPRVNGLELCKRFRNESPSIPIIVITAYGDIETKLDVFSLGADDYLVKPFHNQELYAKIRVFLRRSSPDAPVQDKLQFRDVEVDFNLKAVWRSGQEVTLSRKEFQIFEYLIRNRNRIVSKDDMAMNLWDESYGVSHNTIEVYINFLRKKLDKNFPDKLIYTKPGFGYYIKFDREL